MLIKVGMIWSYINEDIDIGVVGNAFRGGNIDDVPFANTVFTAEGVV